MLTLETLAYLRSPDGARLLAAATSTAAESTGFLQALTRLRRRHPALAAAAALETVELRRRAVRKFARADEMFFTREGLEQASGERVASHCARRFSGFDRVADLCCGIGGDTLALAMVSPRIRVVAIDRDPLRLAIARANAEVCGVADRITFMLGDVGCDPVPDVQAAYCDPGRRTASGRVFDVRRYEPPLAVVLALTRLIPALGIKVAPGIHDSDIPQGCEAEFVQESGELKQATLWLGPVATCSRSATVLPEAASMVHMPTSPLPILDPGSVLYEPEPAIIRAHLVEQLGAALGAGKLDATTAYLTTPPTQVCVAVALKPTPFARAFLVDEWMPFNLKALTRRLRELDVGSVTVKKRASPLDPEVLERMLKLSGAAHRVLVLTRVRGRHSVLICRRAA